MLLIDLQRLYVLAHGAELAWVVLHQVAQAARDERLLHAATEGQEEAERHWKWLRTKIKESCPLSVGRELKRAHTHRAETHRDASLPSEIATASPRVTLGFRPTASPTR